MKKSAFLPKTILITGASSGIGAALARHYAAAGVTLHLQGRNAERLEIVANECRNYRAVVHTALLDVKDASAMKEWIEAIDDKTSIDLAIANAGVSAGFGRNGESSEQVKEIFATNVDGVFNTVHPLLAPMTGRGRGQLAIISSLAGIRALPSCPAYSASKAAVRVYGEALRGAMQKHGVNLSVVCPGYIRTPMTKNNPYPMPFLMSAEKAARIIARGLAGNRARIAFPLGLYIPLWFLSCLSPLITDPMFARLPAKPSHF